MLFKINFFFEIVLFKYARKTQNLRILRGKMRQNVIFCVEIFFKIELFKNNFFFKIVLFKNLFFFKILLFKINFFFEIVLFKYARKTQNLRILRGKMRQNVIFCVEIFFKIVLF